MTENSEGQTIEEWENRFKGNCPNCGEQHYEVTHLEEYCWKCGYYIEYEKCAFKIQKGDDVK